MLSNIDAPREMVSTLSHPIGAVMHRKKYLLSYIHHRHYKSIQDILLNFVGLLLTLLFIVDASLIDAGAVSTPKNLVNSHLSSDIHTANSTQFQNEYQYRQSKSSGASERHKLSTSSVQDTVTPSLASLDHNPSTTNDLTYPSDSSDYAYQDSRVMTNVPDCKGRLKLNKTRGYITDGLGHYQTNLQCIWIIDSGITNATIRIQVHQFNTECNYDFLYIFDGDSVYAPLVAALSGDVKDFSTAFTGAYLEELISSNENNQLTGNIATSKDASGNTSSIETELRTKGVQEPSLVSSSESHTIEIKTYSGKAFIYFHSDTAQNMPGFYMTYSVDSCPLDCSNRGDCDFRTLKCSCSKGFYGEGCQYILCPNNCTSPAHGTCDKEKSCVCSKEYTGKDCSRKADQQPWIKITDNKKSVPPRAFHQSAIVGNKMWIIGGKSQALSNTNLGIFRHKKTTTILSFDLDKREWTDDSRDGITGEDHLAELHGHSVTAYGDKIFIFGGMSMNNSILNTLSVFDTKTLSIDIIPNNKSVKMLQEEFTAPLAVTGHSANIIDGYMYVFMGYNPLYGYLNFVQKFSVSNNSWSFVERRGSSVVGCIGHTSTYDSFSGLIFIYGGHNAARMNKLYSFDPQTAIWTYLRSSPTSRYFHNAILMDGLLMILGGNSYNTSHQSDQCFQDTHLMYDLSCSHLIESGNRTIMANVSCGKKCWSSIEDNSYGILKRHGHSVVVNNNRELILFGGFNGILTNDVFVLEFANCSNYTSEKECNKPRLASNCEWSMISSSCETRDRTLKTNVKQDSECSKTELKSAQVSCESRSTCSDCLNTNLGCVWCGIISQCQYSKCRSVGSRAITSLNMCFGEEMFTETVVVRNSSSSFKELARPSEESERMIDCRTDNCFLCQSRSHCSWQNYACFYDHPNTMPPPPHNMMMNNAEEFGDNSLITSSSILSTNSTSLTTQRFDPFNRSFLAALTNGYLNSSPYTCDVPCFMRKSCNECTTTKCIWCSTTEQCIDSSAYFAYHAMGQCMHYVAHMFKCPVASCSDIETCDKCLTNPKCGWLNDISNTGQGRCMDGNSSGPSFNVATLHLLDALVLTNLTSAQDSAQPNIPLPNWFYTSCPSCQCNGHSFCKSNSSLCAHPCQDFTEGQHCDRCIPGYFGDPINGGTCRPCYCNGHAQTCNRETGKCYCSTKGIIGHNCDRCDDKNYYIGHPSSPGNGTCYYNLTTAYQYTFNMSKPEDHFYSDIYFINIPPRKDTHVDFSIACSRFALVNISSGTSYKKRKPIHTGLECGSFMLRFSHELHPFNDTDFSFFVHVYRFQTPFILQIAFSQGRTLYLPHFFFTFSSCSIVFFALCGLVWKLKYEYHLYIRRQRQFIELEQMASRPFSTILLEMYKPFSKQSTGNKATGAKTQTQELYEQQKQPLVEPTPISFEPCFSSNVGVLSVLVQLPGKPNLAIGSALVSLNDDSSQGSCDEDTEVVSCSKRVQEKEN